MNDFEPDSLHEYERAALAFLNEHKNHPMLSINSIDVFTAGMWLYIGRMMGRRTGYSAFQFARSNEPEVVNQKINADRDMLMERFFKIFSAGLEEGFAKAGEEQAKLVIRTAQGKSPCN